MTPKKKPISEKAAMYSPAKKIKTERPGRLIKGKRLPTISVIAFAPPFGFEAYLCRKPNGDQVFDYGIKKYFRENNDSSQDIAEGNFVGVVDQRVPNTRNEKMPAEEGSEYYKTIVIRYPEDNITTEATRKEGLRLLSNFFKDDRFAKFPLKNIETRDITDTNNYKSLDEFFVDEDIKEMIKEGIDDKDMTPDFFEKHPDYARKLWKYDKTPDWAKEQFGFPEEDN